MKKIFFFFMFFSFLPLSLFSKDSPEQILQFGNHLYQDEYYYRAITEYKRFLYFYPKHPQNSHTEFQIGYSYLKGEKWEAALPYFQKLSTYFPHTRLGENSFFSIAHTHFLSKKYKAAQETWNEFQERYPKSSLNDIAWYQKGWAYFFQEKTKEATQELSLIKNPSLKNKAMLLSTEIEKWHTLPYRSPFLAGMFSAMLPGLGQWYDGRFWDGMSALVVNSMFAYGIYATWRDEHYVAFGIVTFLASGFYGGNIFSAVSSAHKFNRNVKESKWQILQKKYGVNLEWNGNSLTIKF